MTNEVLGGGTFSSRITLGLILGDWSAAKINKNGFQRVFDFSCITPDKLYAKENGDQELTRLAAKFPNVNYFMLGCISPVLHFGYLIQLKKNEYIYLTNINKANSNTHIKHIIKCINRMLADKALVVSQLSHPRG